jgi:hypothetical protein
MLSDNTFTLAKQVLAKHNRIAAIKLILDNKQAWDDLKQYNSLLRNQLYAIAQTENVKGSKYSDLLYQDVYAVLLMFAQRWPLNDKDDSGDFYISPISHDAMATPVCTTKGWQYDINEIEFLVTSEKNALDNTPIIFREVNYLKAKLATLVTTVLTEAETIQLQQQREEASNTRYYNMLEEIQDACIISSMALGIPLFGLMFPAAFFVNVLFLIPVLFTPLITGVISYFYFRNKLVQSQSEGDQLIDEAESLMDKDDNDDDNNLVIQSSTTTVVSSLSIDLLKRAEVDLKVDLDVYEVSHSEQAVSEEIFHHIQARSLR